MPPLRSCLLGRHPCKPYVSTDGGDYKLMAFPFNEVVATLKDFYKGDVPSVTKLANEKRDPFLVLIGCILSLRTKDEVTDAAAIKLFQKARTPREILALPVKELEKLIY